MNDIPGLCTGRTESAVDLVAPTSVAALAAAFDYDTPPREGDVSPLLWH